MSEKVCKLVGWIALVATSASLFLAMEVIK